MAKENGVIAAARKAAANVRKDPRNALLDLARGGLMGVTTDVVGYPVDLMTMALRPLGYDVEKPIGGSDWLADKLTSPTGSAAETSARMATGMVTPGPEDLLRLAGILPKKAPVQELITYHGSPHRINNVDADNPAGKFDIAKVGTGEGAQAYGHGVYLAESPGVAASYKVAGTDGAQFRLINAPPRPKVDALGPDRELAVAYDDAVSKAKSLGIDGAIQYYRDQIASPLFSKYADEYRKPLAALENMKAAGAATEKAGHLYTVDLPDEHIAKMLDWDAPLSEQPESVRKALKNYAVADDASITGGEFYRRLTQEMGASQDEVSEALRGDGIPGIRYLDGNSRATSFGPRGTGTRNFVIFDGDTAKILKRE